MSEPILSPLKRVDPETVERWLRPPASLVSREKAQDLLDEYERLASKDWRTAKLDALYAVPVHWPDLARTVIEQADQIEALRTTARIALDHGKDLDPYMVLPMLGVQAVPS